MKTKLIVFLLSIAFLAVSCRKKEVTKAEKHSKKIELSDETVVFTPDKKLDFSIIKDTSFYYGEINDDDYFIKIDHVDESHIIGRYYPVTDDNMLVMHRFEIEHKKREIILCKDDQTIPIKFEIAVDTDDISGWFTPDEFGSTTRHMTFEKYDEPSFKVANSTRYSPNCPSNLLTFKKVPNVVYGNVKGFWTSRPILHEQKGKMIIAGLAQSATAKRKDLELTMDLYLPEDSVVKRRPTIVLLHGGGFFFGDKGAETSTQWCEHFARIGYVAVSANYRLGFRLTKESIQQCEYEAIQDAHAALRFLMANADKYGIDTNNIFLGGTSAGSIIALNTVYMNDQSAQTAFKDRNLKQTKGSLHNSGNNYTRAPRVKAIANMWGAVYDLSDLEGKHIPVISFHGTEDNIVPYSEGYLFTELKTKIGEKLGGNMFGSEAIHRKLDSLNTRNRFYPIEGAGHAPYEDKRGKPNETYNFIQDKIQQFFYNEINREGSIVQDNADKRIYHLQMKDLNWCNWQVEGGFIMHQDGNDIKVLWRSDAKTRKISASGERINGCAFQIKKTL